MNRRKFAQFLGLSVGSLTLGGCFGLDPRPVAPAITGPFGQADDATSRLASRVLNRIGFGPRPGSVEQLVEMGIDSYFEEQLDPESVVEDPDLLASLDDFETLNLDPDSAREREREWVYDDYVSQVFRKLLQLPLVNAQFEPGPVSRELQQARILRAAYSRRQVFEAMVEFWTDHFSIDQRKGFCRAWKTLDDREIRRHALGKFRDLLRVSMHSPAMLAYLDNADSRRHDDRTGLVPNENYARELLELHTLGVDGGYVLNDIQEVARCLTGWSYGDGWFELDPGRFAFRDEWHDDGEKRVVGFVIPAGQGERDGEQLLDVLCQHPKTAEFIAKKLCRRFVADQPPRRLVEQLTGVFLRTDGDIRQLVRTLLASDEFADPENVKFKRPLDFVVSALRGTNASTTGRGVLPYLELMGQVPFEWAQPDGYPDHVGAWSRGMLPRWRFAIDLLQGRVADTQIDAATLCAATGHTDSSAVCRTLCHLMLGHALPDRVLNAMSRWGADRPVAEAIPQWLAMFVSSPQFQWR